MSIKQSFQTPKFLIAPSTKHSGRTIWTIEYKTKVIFFEIENWKWKPAWANLLLIFWNLILVVWLFIFFLFKKKMEIRPAMKLFLA